MASFNLIEPATLATMLRDPLHQSSTLVVDVRDEDFEGGHIRGAMNVPSEFFYERLPNLVQEKLTDGSINKVVVHCMLSQQRGPRCAEQLCKYLVHQGRAGNPSVMLLRGGFKRFYSVYYTEKDLIETPPQTENAT